MANSILINSSIYQKLCKIASAENCDMRDCLERALNDYIENYEDARRDGLETMNKTERAFFLSVAE